MIRNDFVPNSAQIVLNAYNILICFINIINVHSQTDVPPSTL